MPDPVDLLVVARVLAAADAPLAPSDAQIRRAISTAYYALFHLLLRAGAQRFMGQGTEARPGYALIYRGFTHSRAKSVCAQLQKGRLNDTLQRQLGRQTISQDMQDFAAGVVALQELREAADYDPQAAFHHSDAIGAVEAAHLALVAFERTSSEEQTDVLALMLVSSRS